MNVDALIVDNASLVVRVEEAWEGEMGKHVKPVRRELGPRLGGSIEIQWVVIGKRWNVSPTGLFFLSETV